MSEGVLSRVSILSVELEVIFLLFNCSALQKVGYSLIVHHIKKYEKGSNKQETRIFDL